MDKVGRLLDSMHRDALRARRSGGLTGRRPFATQAILLQCSKDGNSVHSHLTELIHTLLTEKDANALENLENISLAVKAKRFVAAQSAELVRSPRGPLARQVCVRAWDLDSE